MASSAKKMFELNLHKVSTKSANTGLFQVLKNCTYNLGQSSVNKNLN